ncbi:hypothetical protein AAC387_Pa03g2640 [Persea americana]
MASAWTPPWNSTPTILTVKASVGDPLIRIWTSAEEGKCWEVAHSKTDNVRTRASIKSSSGCEGCLKKERSLLLQLKSSFNPPNGVLDEWKGGRCCKWSGVECSNSSRVFLLSLSSALIAGLTQLERGTQTLPFLASSKN